MKTEEQLMDKSMRVRINREDWNKLQAGATLVGLSASDVVRMLIRRWISSQKPDDLTNELTDCVKN